MRDFRHYELVDSIDETLWKFECLDYYHTQEEVERVFIGYLKPEAKKVYILDAKNFKMLNK
jgi:hypothetical protein